MQTAILLVAAWLTAADAAQDQRQPVFREDFNHWNMGTVAGKDGNVVRVVSDDTASGGRGSPCLLVERTASEGSTIHTIDLPVDQLSDGIVTIIATVKAENVGKPPEPWNGVKVMLVIQSDEGMDYPQLPLAHGSFDWQTARRTFRLPTGVTKLTLTLGLEQVGGKAWFDDVEIHSGRIASGTYRQGTMFKGHRLSRLRGVMHGPNFDEQDLRDLAAWNANQVRWQLNWAPMKPAETWAADLDDYDRWLAGALDQADRAVDLCEELDIQMLLDLHCPPGGRAEGGVCRMFTERKYQERFLEIWREIATRYRGREIIYAYDLINEPVEPGNLPDGLLSWRELATEATKIIRRIEPDKPIVFEPGPWGGCEGFDALVPLDLDRVIYSFHMYQPHAFTHQFHYTKRHPEGIVYPGTIQGGDWDKEALRRAMRPAVDFQREFNVHVYVGEFSAIRWAPDNSAHRYIDDLIEIFEEYGWDWSYHAYREWQGWSVEHTTDPNDNQPSSTPTARQKLLQEWFSENERP